MAKQKDNPNLIKNGGEGTKVGNFLRELGRGDILEKALGVAGNIASGNYLGIIKTLTEQDPDITPTMQAEIDKRIDLDYQDRENARKMYTESDHSMADDVAKRVINYNLWVVLAALIIEIGCVFYLEDKVLIAIISGAVGAITQALLQERQQVIAFFFGSSQGSKEKTKMLK